MSELPKELPTDFLNMYYENCDERKLFGDPVYTKEEYWKIWKNLEIKIRENEN